MDRRSFLRRTGAIGASVGSAVLLGTAAGCSSSGTSPPVSTTSVPEGPPDWAALKRSLTGSVVLPRDPTYATARLAFNEQYDTIDPAAVALCATATDVQRCIDFARSHGIPLAARSGGHSYGGYSLTTGLVIDVTPMSRVAPSTRRRTAAIGAGARLIDIYSSLGTVGLLLPGGSCASVGIAGLTLGGGIEVLDRLYGLTCDNLRSATVVTADARVLKVDPSENADLFWACRGGGGGNFGIVTSFEFGVHPLPPDIALFTLQWPWAAAQDVLDAWLRWLAGAPDELWSNCELASEPGLLLRVGGVFVGTTGALQAVLAPFISAVRAPPSSQFVGPESYLRAMLVEAGCEGRTIEECHLRSVTRAGTLERSAYAAKSTFVLHPLPSGGLAAAADALEWAGQTPQGIGAAIAFDSSGGAINRVAPGDTAYVHRNALAGVQITATWGSGPAPANATSWLASAASGLAPYTTGAYQNYIDPTLSDWEHAYYGTNLARLVRVKSSVDPDDVFHFAQSIPTSLGVRA